MTPVDALQFLWREAHGDPDLLDDLTITRPDAHLPSVFDVGTLAAGTIAAQALAASACWNLRSGERQKIVVDARRALAMCRSERYLAIDDKPPPDLWDPIAGYYQAGDGRWIQLHTNFPHHRAGVLRVLGCGPERKEVAAAIGRWKAADLDARLAAEGMCAALIRSPEEWQACEQAQAINSLPLFEVVRIGDAAPQPLPVAMKGGRPLSGVKILDLSRVIAAPVAARTLAQHGGNVLAISAGHLPNLETLLLDTGRGKRSAHVDLRSSPGRELMRGLIKEGDVFLQAYRPGAMASFGLSPEELVVERPGLIYVSLSAYGHVGPWKDRRGFDSLVQSATGIAWEEGQAARLPGHGKLPCQALDHGTGYLMAFATMMALHRRATEGGSWLVRVSLAQTGRWLQSMARVSPERHGEEFSAAEISPWQETSRSASGTIRAMAPVERMERTPPRFDFPSSVLGADDPAW
ncbi:CoA transferase [Noviherbaspirillum galbum]|uniref:CoA transferase n=1 Tax=Noviherbaspirillum galbum TaxID=2709383 RepID=A0A6B3SH17_9BURK|nr:CoA transferase [Noviherbaspirillum galbum]NEX59948.1 CoA transferase [Noviherbaspirillum galbum]